MEVFVLTTDARDEDLDVHKATTNHERFKAYVDLIRSYEKECELPEDYGGAVDAEDTAKQCFINMYGRTAEGKSVCLRIPFSPSLYLEAPEGWCSAEATATAERVYLSIHKRAYGGIAKVTTLRSKKFYGRAL